MACVCFGKHTCVCVCVCKCPYFIPTCFHCLVSWCSTGVVLSAVVNGMREVREAGVNYLLHINGQQWRSVWRASLLHIVSKNVTFPKSTEWKIYLFIFFYLSPLPSLLPCFRRFWALPVHGRFSLQMPALHIFYLQIG